jgi:2-dehydro-3-deoxyphosphooctonate aldolase (KDO 8-P synthase)
MRLIAGPCQHESLEESLYIAEHLVELCDKYGIEYYFKASFDKANRSHIDGIRGLGQNDTVNDFMSMRKEIPDLKILTDVHTEGQISSCHRVVDVLQIPAFLCRQTDLIQTACKTDCIVNIKKGQFLAPWDVKGILSKCEEAKEVWITERGTSFGYNNLVVDFNGMQYMLDNYNVPIVFDATHSCQQPGGLGNSSGGNREYVPGLTRAASAMGVENFFIETHRRPDRAPSDGPNMVYLEDMDQLIENIVEYHYAKH